MKLRVGIVREARKSLESILAIYESSRTGDTP